MTIEAQSQRWWPCAAWVQLVAYPLDGYVHRPLGENRYLKVLITGYAEATVASVTLTVIDVIAFQVG